jgi:hypothetical protein
MFGILEQPVPGLARSAWPWATVKGEPARGVIVGLCPGMDFYYRITVPHVTTSATPARPAGLGACAGPEADEQHEQHRYASSTPHRLHPFRRENDHDPQEEAAEQD